MKGNFKHLLSPAAIGQLTVRNRMIATALVTDFADEDGLPTEQYIRYHEEKARGGWGLVITEDYAILPDGKSHARLPGLWDDSQIGPHTEFVRRVHEAGGTIGVQLFHPGRATTQELAQGNLMAPSPVRDPMMTETPREMDEADIRRVVKAFADAASRAKACGFDLVEIHGAHGYLIGQFFSGFSNKRCGEYGGTLEDRAKFALEVVRAVREAVGPGYPLSFRLGVNDHVQGGVTPFEARIIARLLEREGIDLINCSQGVPASRDVITPPSDIPAARYVAQAATVKSAVSVPIAVVGRICDPLVAEEILASGLSDFVAMGREALADPYFPKKVEQGRPEDIVQCIGCLRGCAGESRRGRSVRCMLNPNTGREAEYDAAYGSRSREDAKRVLVIGGGIAGMQAALTANAQGHSVELVEKSGVLGGQWRLASVPPGKECLASFCAWQKRQLEKSGVSILLNTRATSRMVVERNPDAVIVATGSVPLVPPIPGLQRSLHVVGARSVLSGSVAVFGKVAVLGGGSVGAETAALLAEQGCEVTIVEMAPELAADEEPLPRKHLMGFLQKHAVAMMPNTKVIAVEDGNIQVEGQDGRETLQGFEAIVTAFGACCDSSLAEEIRATSYAGRVIVVGDARCVASGFENLRDAHEAALRL